MIPRKNNTLALDITCITCREAAGLLKNFYIIWNFHARGTQRLFSVIFIGGSKYCLEIFKTWERLACSQALYFLF